MLSFAGLRLLRKPKPLSAFPLRRAIIMFFHSFFGGRFLFSFLQAAPGAVPLPVSAFATALFAKIHPGVRGGCRCAEVF